MKKYILTKDFLEIAETSGIFQNLSGDANIEITNNTNEQGILLKPFQKVQLNQKVYARKVTGGGTAQLIVLPFSDSVAENDAAENSYNENSYSENYFDENFNRPHQNKNRHVYDYRRAREQPPPPPFFPPDDFNPAVIEHENFYFMKIPKNSLNGQNKFLVQINDLKGND